MASTTILYLRHDAAEQWALRKAVTDAKAAACYAGQDQDRNPCPANAEEFRRATLHADLLGNLLARYEGSLAAVGK
jgi:hypothetical protein